MNLFFDTETKSIYRNSSTGVKGVHWHKKHQKYCAVISFEKKTRHLGLFDDIQEAAKVRRAAAQQLHGAFAS